MSSLLTFKKKKFTNMNNEGYNNNMQLNSQIFKIHIKLKDI